MGGRQYVSLLLALTKRASLGMAASACVLHHCHIWPPSLLRTEIMHMHLRRCLQRSCFRPTSHISLFSHSPYVYRCIASHTSTFVAEETDERSGVKKKFFVASDPDSGPTQITIQRERAGARAMPSHRSAVCRLSVRGCLFAGSSGGLSLSMLRARVVRFLQSCFLPEQYQTAVTQDYTKYISWMAVSGACACACVHFACVLVCVCVRVCARVRVVCVRVL